MATGVPNHAQWALYHERISTAYIVVLAFAVVIIAALLGFHHLLRPVDKLSPPAGKQWKLPPGPAGWPLIGNLLMYGNGEAAVSCPLPP